MMRLPILGLACLLLAGCAGSEPARPRIAAAPPVVATGPAVVASTLEVRIDASALGQAPLDEARLQRSLASVTVTEFLPAQDAAVPPVQGSHVEGSRIITHFAPNAYRQAISTDDRGIIQFSHQSVAPGWYTVYSFGSTAGAGGTADFNVEQLRKGQRSCLVTGAKLAPGVRPVELKPSEIGYFGHFVITIAVRPGAGPSAPYETAVADAVIAPAPRELTDLLRQDGLDPSHLRRVAASRFPCPWTIPRPGAV